MSLATLAKQKSPIREPQALLPAEKPAPKCLEVESMWTVCLEAFAGNKWHLKYPLTMTFWAPPQVEFRPLFPLHDLETKRIVNQRTPQA